MIVVGGSYHEECQFPHNRDFFGPGIRAAAVIQNISESRTQLHTCIAEEERELLNTYASTFEFDTHTTEIPQSITFDYLHNHSSPRLVPRGARNFQATLSGITGDTILRFGLTEGTAEVSGERVVYDPQDEDPHSFSANGSDAEELALVLNRAEAEKLSSEQEMSSIFSELMEGSDGADVVVVKRGAKGAILRTSSETSSIPAFQTESVWGIGSGDVFSGVFAGVWAECENPAEEAAVTAAKATAWYCQNRHIPIPRDLSTTPIESAPTHFISPEQPPPTIYLAGPFFDIGERFVVEEVKHILENEGINVTSPVHDVGRAADHRDPEEVAEQDLAAIEDADLVFALLDHPDSGTYFELGYARRAGKPVIGYVPDPEKQEDTMISGSGCEIFGDLASAVYNAVWRAYA
jgi:hypothetical protein